MLNNHTNHGTETGKEPASGTPAYTPPQKVTFLVVPRFNMAELITMIEPMRIANYLSQRPIYQWEIVSFDGAEIVASNGLSVTASIPDDSNRRGERIFVLASWGGEKYHNRTLFSWLRRQSRSGARICAIELGCYLVARAGLLSGRKVAIHWSWAPGFQEQFDDVTVVDQMFTDDDQVMTCAGGLAGIDLMLKLLGDAHGDRLAGEVADQMLHHRINPESTPQRRKMLQKMETLPTVVRDAIALIEQRVSNPIGVPELARLVGSSQRQLERLFQSSVGCTTVQFYLLFRLQHARVLLTATDLTVLDIATASGFSSQSHFANAFKKCFGRRPSDYRQAWPKDDAAPSWPGTLAKFLETLNQR